jgi:hypothetical protein
VTEEEPRDDEDPGEIKTTFATKGVGWSGREQEGDDLNVVELDE